jgi:hypothetical protein
MQSFRFFLFQRGERGLSGTAFFLVQWFTRAGMAKGLAGVPRGGAALGRGVSRLTGCSLGWLQDM